MVLICIDSVFDLFVFDVNGLINAQSDFGLLVDLNLFDDSHLFDLVAKHTDESSGLSLLDSQQDLMAQKVSQQKQRLQN